MVHHDKVLTLLLKFFLIVSIICMYFKLTDSTTRSGGCVGSLVFVIIETLWTTFFHSDIRGKMSFGWKGKFGHSSFAQFWSNIIFTPMMLFQYRYIIHNSTMRVILFPLNIWWLEIVEGYLLIFLFGKNIAWEYYGWDAYCHGNIKLQFYIPWVCLGLVVESLWIYMYPIFVLMGLSNFTYAIIILAATLTASFSPCLGVHALMNTLKSLT